MPFQICSEDANKVKYLLVSFTEEVSEFKHIMFSVIFWDQTFWPV